MYWWQIALKPIFDWAESSWLGEAISSRTYPFAIIEVIHLFGLTLLLGGVCFMAMRLFGLIMTDQPLSQFSRGVRLWTTLGLFLSASTGLCLYASEANKLFNSPSFWVKMGFFIPATIFHFTIGRMVTRSDKSGPMAQKLVALLSIVLWFGVGLAGRAIGFL